ncbi:hypothetical protein OG585_03460 [Streptomyces sp. NBC_01340]|uniref:hypothetical protein n=1 Tax=Streptomyces sp. NBC_01340 TaxID=2903830 RepID=UPI002E0DB0B7|nr:hypothetical protein OG585_03460 [Streptomyces sp. NBC_01340]
MPSLSAELQSVEWLDGATQPAPGVRFVGRSSHEALGEWAMQLTAVVLATYTSGEAGSTDMEVLAHLCGHSPRQAEEFLDRLVASRSPAA